MLGLADRARIVDLFEHVMKGDVAAALAEFRSQYDTGADPAAVLTDLAEFNHLVTRLRFVPTAADDASLSEDERRRGADFAEHAVGQGAVADLADAAQGHSRGAVVQPAGQRRRNGADPARACRRPADAGRGAEIAGERRLRFERRAASERSAGQPRPGNGNGGASAVAQTRMPIPVAAARRPCGWSRPRTVAGRSFVAAAASRSSKTPAVPVKSLADIVALADAHRDMAFKVQVKRCVRLVRIEPGRIDVSLTDDAPKMLLNDLTAKLRAWTGRNWLVSLSKEEGGQTLAEMESTKRETAFSDAKSDPTVAAILARFPGAKIIDVRIPDAPEVDTDKAEAAGRATGATTTKPDHSTNPQRTRP